MAGGAPKGNKNAAKPHLWDGALRKALAKDRERLNRIAESLVSKAEAGEQWAMLELGNRLDGKPVQAIAGSGEDGSHQMTVTIREE